MPDFLLCLLFGIALGTLSKYLDTIPDDGSWGAIFLNHLGDLFTRLGIWVLIATIIAAYSRTLIRAAINTFLFFIGMLVSYYVYSAYLFGFFPTSYFIFWGGIALLSPLLAMIVWLAKNKENLAYFLPALPMGLLFSLSSGIGLFYMDIIYLDEFIMYLVLCAIFYKNPKQLSFIVIFSIVVSVIYSYITPFYF